MLAWKTLTRKLRQWKDFEAVETEHVVVRKKRKRARVAIDGETMVMTTPLEYRILPRAMKVLVPASVPTASHNNVSPNQSPVSPNPGGAVPDRGTSDEKP